ncbi:hypothetical protein ACOXXX_13780 [Thalassococcus sp. BH17M4-6]|uniref:hypothetical protein n=1 Tax=Thalassococcus sp. BH17M4-6 TaxID=3413148 RepID=UPI003BBF9546
MDAPRLDFKSPEELAQLLQVISRRLHYINRVSGESRYMWHLAETIAAAGRLAERIKDDEVTAVFGTGYDPETLTREERRDLMLSYLEQEMRV